MTISPFPRLPSTPRTPTRPLPRPPRLPRTPIHRIPPLPRLPNRYAVDPGTPWTL